MYLEQPSNKNNFANISRIPADIALSDHPRTISTDQRRVENNEDHPDENTRSGILSTGSPSPVKVR